MYDVRSKLGAWDKSPVTIFAPPLSDHFTRFSVKYRPVFALKTRKTDKKIRHKSDNGLLSQAPSSCGGFDLCGSGKSSSPTFDGKFRQMQEKNIPALDSLLAGINSRCEPGDASRKHSEGAFSDGGIHHLRRPGAKLPERCWSQLMISPP